MAKGEKGETGSITIWDFSDQIYCLSHSTWVVLRRQNGLTVPIYGVDSLEKHKGVVKTLEWVKGHFLFHPIRKLSDLIKLANWTNCMKSFMSGLFKLRQPLVARRRPRSIQHNFEK